MGRNNRRMKEMSTSDKFILYSTIGVIILAVIITALFLYSKKLNDDVRNSTMSLEEMANLTNNTSQESESENKSESASTEIGKSVEEAENEMKSKNNANSTNSINSTNTSNSINSNTTNTNNNMNNTSNSSANNVNATNSNNNSVATASENQESETKKELSFERPVEGEIVREFAKDSLIYSETLQEWTTHTGIDIKADKTTVVKSAEAGTIKSIKNDPRYGLTIVIEHDDQYQTIYSNLLTSEFVVEGEKVEKGQAIGTVGNTAVFEIADEPHLHFEIWKDSLPVDPTTLMK